MIIVQVVDLDIVWLEINIAGVGNINLFCIYIVSVFFHSIKGPVPTNCNSKGTKKM